MKLLVRCFFTALISSALLLPAKLQAQESSLNFQIFYDNLSPYGNWIDYPNYGYAWVPNAGPDFIPYSTGGYWAMTSYGWTWVSDYKWGWAPFHYGRWWYDSYYGWFWIPDNVWGPAWVIWRTSPGYYGWAPLGPNISLTFAMGGGYIPPVDYWCYAPSQYMGRENINNYYGPRKNTSDFINTSTVVNNIYIDNRTQTNYIAGPKQEEVEKATGRTIKPLTIKENTKPGQQLENNELKLYRPVISNKNSDEVKPKKIVEKKDIRPVSERTNTGTEKNINKNAPTKTDKSVPAQKERALPKTEKQQQPVIQNKNKQHNPVQSQQPQAQPVKKQLEKQPPVQQPEVEQREKQIPMQQPQPIPKQETQKAVAPSEHQIDRPVQQNVDKPLPQMPPAVQPTQQPPPKMDNQVPVKQVPQQNVPRAPH